MSPVPPISGGGGGGGGVTTPQMNAAISAAVADLIDGAPGALDTLNELSAALQDDPDAAANLAQSITVAQSFANDAKNEVEAHTDGVGYKHLAVNLEVEPGAGLDGGSVQDALSTAQIAANQARGIADGAVSDAQTAQDTANNAQIDAGAANLNAQSAIDGLVQHTQSTIAHPAVNIDFDPVPSGTSSSNVQEGIDFATNLAVATSTTLGTVQTTANSNEAELAQIREFAGNPAFGTGLRVIQALYDFDELGGAIGTINLTTVDGDPLILPPGLQVIAGGARIFTPFEDGGSFTSTLKIGLTSFPDAFLGGANQIDAFAGLVAVALGQLVAQAPAVDSNDQVQVEIATTPLTAGRMLVSLLAVNVNY